MRIYTYVSIEPFDTGHRIEFFFLPSIAALFDNGRISMLYLSWFLFHAELSFDSDQQLPPIVVIPEKKF